MALWAAVCEAEHPELDACTALQWAPPASAADAASTIARAITAVNLRMRTFETSIDAPKNVP
jgi:hypothetical protein